MASTTITFSTGGFNGLLDWLGKDKGTTTWANPDTTRGYVTVGGFPLLSGSHLPYNAVDQTTNYVIGDTVYGPFMSYLCFDFGGPYVKANHVGWLHRSGVSENMTSVKLEASLDGWAWTELGDLSFGDNAGTWENAAVTNSTYYRFYRFIPDALSNSTADYAIVVDDVEFYGDYDDSLTAGAASALANIPLYKDAYALGGGILSWLGNGKDWVTTWSNPDTGLGVVSTSQSSTIGGMTSERALTADAEISTGRSHTDNIAGSWWKVDFGTTNPVVVSDAAIRAHNFGSNLPRNFKLQGSNDDSNWDDLATVTGDGPAQKSWYHMANIDSETEYRYLRILSTGADSSGGNYLILAGFEVWGTYGVGVVTIDFAGTGSETFDGTKIHNLDFSGDGTLGLSATRETFNTAELAGTGGFDAVGEFFGYATGSAAFSGTGDLIVGGFIEKDGTLALTGSGTFVSEGRVSDAYAASVAFSNDDASLTLQVFGQRRRPIESGTWYRKDGRFVFVWGHMRSRKRGYPAAWEAVSPRVRYVDVSDVEDVSWPVLTANSGDDAAVLLGKMRTALTNAGFILVN